MRKVRLTTSPATIARLVISSRRLPMAISKTRLDKQATFHGFLRMVAGPPKPKHAATIHEYNGDFLYCLGLPLDRHTQMQSHCDLCHCKQQVGVVRAHTLCQSPDIMLSFGQNMALTRHLTAGPLMHAIILSWTASSKASAHLSRASALGTVCSCKCCQQ